MINLQAQLPYELIGKVTVAIFLLAIVVFIGISTIVTLLWLWVRFWKFVINLAWGEYDPLDDELPPQWRRKISIVAYGLSEFKHPRDIHGRVKEVHELNDEPE